MPASIEVLAETRADRALLHDVELGRQRAGAQQNREIIGLLGGEAAGDLTRAAGDWTENARRRDHLVVEHDRKQAADVLRRDLAKFQRASGVETEVDDRLAAALVEAHLRVRQILALHHDLLFNGDLPGLIALLELLGLARGLAGVGDKPEFQLRRLAEHFLQLLRILKARHLHDDAVVALALDARLPRPELVDALSDDLDRLVDRGAHLLSEPGLGQAHANEFVARVLDVERRRTAEHRGVMPAERLELRQDLLAVGGVRHADLHAARGLADAPSDRDFFLTQQTAHVVAQIARLRVQHGAAIDLEHQIGAALEIEAEHDRWRHEPGRHDRGELLIVRGREHAWDDDGERHEGHADDRDDLPGGETQHCLL